MANIIEVQSISKKYKIYSSPKKRLIEAFHPAQKKMHKEFWALQDISFSIRKGESVGIIGVNGSGKSTLLQTVCGVLKPTTGSCSTNGRITALLELGTGFSLESTGKENIFLQGAMLGFSYKEMEDFFPVIEKFADIGEFIYRPMKQYSSGMLVRLAISVAFQLHPDVLIVDEALSVGDIFFQAKCINKLQEMRQEGVTLLFVSHDMGTVRTLCDRAILIDKGRLIFDGDPPEAVETYHAHRARQMGAVNLEKPEPSPDPEASPAAYEGRPPQPGDETKKPLSTGNEMKIDSKRYGNGKGRLVSYTINGNEHCQETFLESGGKLDAILEFCIDESIRNPVAGIMLRTVHGTELFGSNTTYANTPLGQANPGERLKVNFSQYLHLNNGQYLLTLTLAEWNEKGEIIYVDRHVNAVCILVVNGPFPYSGICNLQGTITFEKL